MKLKPKEIGAGIGGGVSGIFLDHYLRRVKGAYESRTGDKGELLPVDTRLDVALGVGLHVLAIGAPAVAAYFTRGILRSALIGMAAGAAYETLASEVLADTTLRPLDPFRSVLSPIQ